MLEILGKTVYLAIEEDVELIKAKLFGNLMKEEKNPK